MEIYQGSYYHIYNRTNNNELAFKSETNYIYFLKKYRLYFDSLMTTVAYCLMPTHFHFLVFIDSNDTQRIKRKIGDLLSSYTKAINKRYKRHGSLFQSHTKASLIKDEKYLLVATVYIHWNPVHSSLVRNPEEWLYSSYRDYIGMRKGTLPNTKIILSKFSTLQEFIEFSQRQVPKKEFANLFKISKNSDRERKMKT